MQLVKRFLVINFKLGLWIAAWPVMLGFKLSKHAHRKIEIPALRYLAIGAIMLPSLTVGTVWAAAITHPSVQQTANKPEPVKPDLTVKTQPKIEKKIETQTEEIVFEEQRPDDVNLAKGQVVLKQEGKNGVKTITYEVTYSEGRETGRVKTKEEVTTAPVPKVIAIGTKVVVAAAPKKVTSPPPPAAALPASNCDPNYTPCVPIDSDVDCLGGRGNGPSYVKGPVKVIGADKYGLDSNHDGWGCEN